MMFSDFLEKNYFILWRRMTGCYGSLAVPGEVLLCGDENSFRPVTAFGQAVSKDE